MLCGQLNGALAISSVSSAASARVGSVATSQAYATLALEAAMIPVNFGRPLLHICLIDMTIMTGCRIWIFLRFDYFK